MPHSPISRTDSGSVSAIKQFIFGSVLDTSRYLPDDASGTTATNGSKRGLKSQAIKSQILRSQVFRPQVLKSQIIKSKIQRSQAFNPGMCEDDVNFPNNLRSLGPDSRQNHNIVRSPVPKLNNLTNSPGFQSSNSNLYEDKSSHLYGSTPNLSQDPSTELPRGAYGARIHGPGVVGTLPRNFHSRDPKYSGAYNSSSGDSEVVASSASSMCSSCAHMSNTTSDSGFLSDSTYPESERTTSLQRQHDHSAKIPPPADKDCRLQEAKEPPAPPPHERLMLHQDNPTYGCIIQETTTCPTVTHASKEEPRKSGRQVSSVTLQIENGLFATASKEPAVSEGRARDRRPLDPNCPALPPPPSCIIVKKETPEEEEEEDVGGGGGGWKTATMTTSGTFLARCVKIEDL